MGIPGIPFSNHDYAPFDRSFCLTDNGITNSLVTLGTGSYVSEIVFDLGNRVRANALIGRFCSISGNIAFIIGQNHSYRNVVSTWGFDGIDFMKKFLHNCGMDNLEDFSFVPKTDPSANHYQVIVGNDVWIGRSATIRGGVRIGSGAIVGTRAVVMKDVPPYAIVAGNPARIINYRFDEETIKKFMAIKWWNWDLKKIVQNIPLMKNSEKFLETHYSPELIDNSAQIGGVRY